jgi:hypothetical protein
LDQQDRQKLSAEGRGGPTASKATASGRVQVSDTAVIEKEPETAPAELPADVAAPEPSLEDLLADFERATAKPDLEPDGSQETDAPVEDVDTFLNDLNKDAQRVTELEGQLGSLRAVELDRQSRADFEGFSTKLQEQLGPNVDDQFARTNLLSMAVENPALEAAWRYRNLTDAERRAADLEFQQLEVLYHRVQQAPDDPRKAAALAEMERRGQELGLMMNARTILGNARRDVLNRARTAQPPIDLEMTALRDEIAWAVRESRHGDIPDPPVNLGNLSDAEYRNYLRKNFGIAGF